MIQTGTTTINPVAHVWNEQDEDTFTRDRSLLISGEDIYTKQTASLSLGATSGNVIANGSMDSWSSLSNIDEWTEQPGLIVSQVPGNTATYGARLDGKLTSFNTGGFPPTSSYMTSSPFQLTANDGIGGNIDLSFEYRVDAGTTTSGTSNIYFLLSIRDSSGTPYYYKSSNDTWNTAISYETITPGTYNSWHTHTLNSITLNFSSVIVGEDEVELLLRLIKVEETSSTDITSVTYSNVDAQISTAERTRSHTETSTYVRSITPEDIVFQTGDGSNFFNEKGIKLGVSISDGKTYKWARNGITESKSLLELLTQTIMSDNFYGEGTWRLSGSIKGDFNFNTIIQFNSLEIGETVILIPGGLSYDVKRETWSGEWLEIGRASFGTLDLLAAEQGFLLLTEDGDYIMIE